MADQPAHVIDKGNQISLAIFAVHRNRWSVHDVGLPEVVGQFGLKAAPVHRRLFTRWHQSLAFKQPPHRAFGQVLLGLDHAPLASGANQSMDGGGGHLTAQPDQRNGGLWIERPSLTAIGSAVRIERFEPLAAFLVGTNPRANGAGGKSGALGERNLPLAGALLLEQPRALAPTQPCRADKIADHPKAEDRYLFFLFVIHRETLLG